jgi:hypothetical protein
MLKCHQNKEKKETKKRNRPKNGPKIKITIFWCTDELDCSIKAWMDLNNQVQKGGEKNKNPGGGPGDFIKKRAKRCTHRGVAHARA